MTHKKITKEEKQVKQQSLSELPDHITAPVSLKSGDKLRENPSNDEETIAQHPRKNNPQQSEQPPVSIQHGGEKMQVTNEEDQQEIVNQTTDNRQ
jgi:hypothetical protein